MRIITIVLLLALHACATPSQRISASLERYGFDPVRADCIGDYVENRLSLGQLISLKRAVDAVTPRAGRPTSLTDLIATGASLDPAIHVALIGSGMACAVP